MSSFRLTLYEGLKGVWVIKWVEEQIDTTRTNKHTHTHTNTEIQRKAKKRQGLALTTTRPAEFRPTVRDRRDVRIR